MSHQPLPVAGYTEQPTDAVELVNENKQLEEIVLRVIDDLRVVPRIDQRWLSVGATHIEQGFMALNRAIFRPTRLDLPEDAE